MSMFVRHFFTCVIIFQLFLVERSFQKQTTLFFTNVNVKTNPSIMNITQLTFKYKSIGSSKYIESIDPFTVHFHRDLQTFVVSENLLFNSSCKILQNCFRWQLS